MAGELVAEDEGRACDETEDAVRVCTGPTARDLPFEPFEALVGLGRVAVAPGNRLQALGERAQPEHAGAALGCALRGHVGDDARRLDDAARTVAEHDDRPCAGARAHFGEALPAEAQARPRWHPVAEVPTDEVG